MDNEDRAFREEEVRQAHAARSILENPLWTAAWDTFMDEIVRAWAETGSGENERRELLYFQLTAAEQARGNLETILETGKMAEQQLENDA